MSRDLLPVAHAVLARVVLEGVNGLTEGNAGPEGDAVVVHDDGLQLGHVVQVDVEVERIAQVRVNTYGKIGENMKGKKLEERS